MDVGHGGRKGGPTRPSGRPRSDRCPSAPGVLLSTRPLLAATAAASALLIGGASVAPALAATPSNAAAAAVPAKGLGSSALSMINIAAGGHEFSVGQLALLSDTATAATALATATVTPLIVDGTT